MKKRLKSVLDMLGGVRTGGSFIQNSAWMFSSSGISILIQTAFFVILARIYPPEVYGLFGIFNVYLGVLGNAATLGYNQAFVLPENDQKFSRLLQLSIWVSLAVCCLAELFFLAAGDGMLAMFHHNELGWWLYAVPPIALLMALDRLVCDWAIRNKEFRQQMLWSTSTTLFAKSFNVLYGLRIAPTVAGLVATTALQYLLRIVAYSRFALVDFSERLSQAATWQELKTTAHEYIDYPKYVHWGNVINIFSNTLPAAVLPALGFGLDEVGFYTNSLIMLDMPIRMLGAGVTSVFMQKAAEIVRDRKHELAQHTWRLYKNMLFIALLFMFAVCIAGEPLYKFFLGDKWSMAGRAAEVLVIFYFFRMISSPLSSLFNILRKEKESFWFQVILAVVRIAALCIGAHYTSDFIQLMWIYTMANAVMYFIYCLWIFLLIQYSLMRVALLTLGGFALVMLAVYTIKMILILT